MGHFVQYIMFKTKKALSETILVSYVANLNMDQNYLFHFAVKPKGVTFTLQQYFT